MNPVVGQTETDRYTTDKSAQSVYGASAKSFKTIKSKIVSLCAAIERKQQPTAGTSSSAQVAPASKQPRESTFSIDVSAQLTTTGNMDQPVKLLLSLTGSGHLVAMLNSIDDEELPDYVNWSLSTRDIAYIEGGSNPSPLPAELSDSGSLHFTCNCCSQPVLLEDACLDVAPCAGWGGVSRPISMPH